MASSANSGWSFEALINGMHPEKTCRETSSGGGLGFRDARV